MTEKEIKEILKNNGWAQHVYEGGSKYLLKKWKAIVEDVEKGYHPNSILEEYWNDLATRSAIYLVGLGQNVKDLDQRFKNAVTGTNVKIWENNDGENEFWHYGYPKNAKGNFLAEIKNYISQHVMKQ